MFLWCRGYLMLNPLPPVLTRLNHRLNPLWQHSIRLGIHLHLVSICIYQICLLSRFTLLLEVHELDNSSHEAATCNIVFFPVIVSFLKAISTTCNYRCNYLKMPRVAT